MTETTIEPRQPRRLEKKANIDCYRPAIRHRLHMEWWMASRLNSAQPAEARVSILLYDALDFSTDRDDGGGQTRESLSRIASPSAAVARLDPARTETHVALCDYPVAGCVRPVKVEGFAPDVPINSRALVRLSRAR
jgi:hypothetical protein